MSNVRRHGAACCENPRILRSERAVKEALPKSTSIGAAKNESLNSASSFLAAPHEWSALAQAQSKASVSQLVGPLLRKGNTSAPRETSNVGHLSSGSDMPSRSPSASRKSSLSHSHKAFVAWHLGNSYSQAMQAKEAFHTETPNPSIERTRSGGASLAFISFWAKPAPPPRAAHVKR